MIYDCVTYFDEDLILDLRFNILNKYIDKFIVVESDIDHAGNKKKLNFNIENFGQFKDKIIYYVVRDMPIKVGNFKKNWSPNFIRENFQRNAIQNCIENCNEKDLILVSDADEIPNLENLNNIEIKRFALFKQISFLYKLNLVEHWNWLGTGICYYKYLKSPQWLRDKRFLRRGFLRRIFFKTQIIDNGGWHFSYLKSPDNILKKVQSFAHSEFKDISLDHIKQSMNNMKHIITPDHEDKKISKIQIDQNIYPNYIFNNREIFKDWIA
tara:strand:- start:165 stop:968 length:804 start_codon:yes stop_codon:yes gene_type:complete